MAHIVITGANRGIGLEMARQFVARGDTVTALCRSASPALRDLGARIIDDVDVTADDLSALTDAFGDAPIDVLINNAGLLSFEHLGDLNLASIRQQFEVNALGPLKITHALLGNLREGSKVGLVTSRMGSLADNTSGRQYGYRMSKAALNMAGVSLAHDLKRKGIAVVLLHPGFVRTEMTRGNGNVEPDEAAKGLIARIDALTLETTGSFWHADGQQLPW
jgi:NAD(P)-dependent dehydrogenase (short-subunit alcohol dehydrogenase family)